MQGNRGRKPRLSTSATHKRTSCVSNVEVEHVVSASGPAVMVPMAIQIMTI